jgi:MFS family permease
MDRRAASAHLVRRIFVAVAVTLTGDAVTLVALPLTAVVVLGASAGELALVGLAQALPILLLSIPLGAWVDRRADRWSLLFASDLARAGLLVLIPVTAMAGVLTLPLLVVVAFLVSCGGTLYDLAFAGWIPRLLSGDALHRANARIELARSGALVAGPLLAGVIVAAFTAPIALLADAASFVGSAVLIGSARGAEPHFEPDRTRRRMREDLTAGICFLRRQRTVAAVVATISINNLSRNIALGIVVLYLVDSGLGPGEVAIAFALGNAGFLVGALAARPLTARIGMGVTMQLGVSLFGPSMLLFALAPAALAGPAFTLMLFANGFGIAIHNVNQVTVRQILTPDRLRARVASVIRLLGFGAVPIGTLIGGLIGELLGVRSALIASGVGLLAGSVPYALQRVGRIRTVDDLPPADAVDGLPMSAQIAPGR